jgi:hypothetical protein
MILGGHDMQTIDAAAQPGAPLEADLTDFYRHILQTLHDAAIPFLIGGAYGLYHYTGVNRDTRDLDVFIRRADFGRVAQVAQANGHGAELTFPHWLGKIRFGDTHVDLIFSAANGIAEVDDIWFAHGEPDELLGVPVTICPVEETIWSKAFIMERERFDGADIAHLLLARGDRIDWPRLLARFGPNWRVLLSHLTLFGFAYPEQRDRVPEWVIDTLVERLRIEAHSEPPRDHVCRGTLLSREQYLCDIEQQNWLDARVPPVGELSPADIAHWTAAIPGRKGGS